MKFCIKFPSKKRYGTQKQAEEVIRLRLGNARLHSYACKVCKGWHLSSRRID